MIKTFLKSTHKFLTGKLPPEKASSEATRLYRNRISSDAELASFAERYRTAIQKHRPDIEDGLHEHSALHLTIQVYEILRCVKSRMNGTKGLIADLGASDSLFLEELDRGGFGFNIIKSCASRIQSQGYDGIVGNLEELPFETKSLDYVLCFETLEHVTDPILSLREIRRVCREKAFVSIPWVPRSRFHDPTPDGAACKHIFEYSPEDFPKVAAIAGFRIAHYEKLDILGNGVDPLSSLYLNRFYLQPRGGYFPAFQFYELIPND